MSMAGNYTRFRNDPPYASIGFLGFICASWLSNILNKIYRQEFKPEEELWDCAEWERSTETGDRLSRLWKEEVRLRGIQKASFLRVLIRFGFSGFLIIALGNLGMAAAIFLSTSVCVNTLLTYASMADRDLLYGLGLVGALTAMMVMRIVCQSLVMNHGIFLGVRIRTATVSFLYRKVLKIRDMGEDTVGMLVNVLAADGQRIQRGVLFSLNMLCGPPVLIAGTIYAVVQVGPLSLLGSIVFALEVLVVIKLISEVLASIKTIKVHAWERSFAESILAVRKKERDVLFKIRVIQSMSTFASANAMVIGQLLAITALILVDSNVTAVEIFSLIAVLSSLKIAVELLPSSMRSLADLMVACQRVKMVLMLDEYDPPPMITDRVEDSKYCVIFRRATFAHVSHVDRIEVRRREDKDKAPATDDYAIEAVDIGDDKGDCEEDDPEAALQPKWKKNYGALHGPNQGLNGDVVKREKYQKKPKPEQKILPSLERLNFGIEKSKLTGICGAIGTGKSSLLQAILGRMKLLSGSFGTHGRVAYVPQQAWVMNATLKDNIVFGYPYDEARYENTINVCCLKEDISMLSAGENTEIGERGINLSGGQKQRISLARAVYSDRDLYLLDDPLSAVDNRVGTALFNNCIRRELHGKGVLLVTHQVRFLAHCDKVIFMKHSGIVADSTHEELMRLDEEYHDMIRSVENENKRKKDEHSDDSPDDDTTTLKPPKPMEVSTKENHNGNGQLMKKEEVVSGGIDWSTVRAYVKAAGGPLPIVIALLVIVLFVCSQAFPIWWLTLWMKKVEGEDKETIPVNGDGFVLYMSVYGCSGLVVVLLGLLTAFIMARMTFRASDGLHVRLLRRVMTGKMSFFDVTPIGQIQNQFSSDMDQVDSFLTYNMEVTVYYLLFSLVIVISVAYSTPIVLIVVLPVLASFWYIWSRSSAAIRDLKRLENVARSPLYSMMTSTVHGLTAITAYGKTDQFAQKFSDTLDHYQVRLLLSSVVSRWTGIRLDSVSILLVFATALLTVISPDSQSSAQAGMALTFALQFTGLLTMASLFSNEFLAAFTSVERMNKYIENFPLEQRCVKPFYEPESTWPEKGDILFHKFNLRYQKHMPYVLRKLNLHVHAGDKVGVVGRTGAGKSSLMVALYRLVEGSSGGIFIDGVDITTLPIRQLRAKLSLIPQDPVLFSGTIRYNVDPFNVMVDCDIWESFRKCHLLEMISRLPGKLDESVSEGGLNFSVGERQLICMARALLHQSKVMLLDEATASVDPQTDALIQETIRTSFPDCTMLIIAHRLNTVLDCDKILVMESGQVAEYDTPSALLSDPTSKFQQLLNAADN